MTTETAPLPAPKDNLFGVCAALGRDFGVNPLWLRIAFAVGLLVKFEAVIAIYVVLGLAVALSRLIVRTPRPKPAGEIAPAAPVARAPQEQVELARAA